MEKIFSFRRDNCFVKNAALCLSEWSNIGPAHCVSPASLGTSLSLVEIFYYFPCLVVFARSHSLFFHPARLFISPRDASTDPEMKKLFQKPVRRRGQLFFTTRRRHWSVINYAIVRLQRSENRWGKKRRVKRMLTRLNSFLAGMSMANYKAIKKRISRFVRRARKSGPLVMFDFEDGSVG